jgi:uncharacterized membrane protein YhhN
LISLAAGILALMFPRLGFPVVVYILAFALFLLGIERLGMGVRGHALIPEREQAK